MRNWLRGKRRGLAGFLLICGLVAGGLGWVTTAALRLEREQHEARLQADRDEKLRLWQRAQEQTRQAQQQQRAEQEAQAQEEFLHRLRLALWKLDSRMAPILAREDMRPYNHYSAVFAPPIVLDPKGNRLDTATVLEPSPLLNAELPDWMLLHFQASAEDGWDSPQVLSKPYQRQLTKNSVNFSNVTDARRHLLDELSFSATSQTLLGQVYRQEVQLATPAQEAILENVAQSGGPNGTTWNKNKDQPPASQFGPPTEQQAALGGRKDPGGGYPSRVNVRSQMANEGRDRFGVYGDNASTAVQSVTYLMNPAGPGRPRVGLRDQVLVRLGPMTPVWLLTDGRKDRLIVARRVRITSRLVEELAVLSAWPGAAAPVGLAVVTLNQCSQSKLPEPREVCQGIVLDWPRLQKLLADEVADLFPRARVLPLRADPPPHPERTMTALPVELDPGEGPAPVPPLPPPGPAPELAPVAEASLGWTPLRMGLGLAWAAALVALGAVGLGGWSLLNLSERRIRFVSAVTHELRTPLTTLRLYLDMLTGGLVKDEQRKAEYLETLNTETDRLTRLVGNVLDFSRLENQRPRLVQTETTVGTLLEELGTTWQERCHSAGKDLMVDGGAGDGAALVTDVQLVQQILGNLIDNARKYSHDAEDRHIWVRALLAGQSVVIEVEDRGPGVPKREQRSIFRAFCRGHSADVTAGGVGLGLALAERWARLLGGTLTLCNDAQRVGACFRLELPLLGR